MTNGVVKLADTSSNIIKDCVEFSTMGMVTYMLKYKHIPYIWEFDKDEFPILIENLLKELEAKFDKYKVIQKSQSMDGTPNNLIIKLDKYLLLQINYIDIVDYTEYSGLSTNLRKKMASSTQVRILYHPCVEETVDVVVDIIKNNSIDLNESSGASVGVVARNPYDNSFEVSSFDLSINLNESFYEEMDLHYGTGFEEYYKNLLKLVENNKKGLILFHGEPGTGKSYFIRHLIKSLTKKGKIFIYLPFELLLNATEPGFLTFLIEEVTKHKKENKNIILVIEDAEALLTSREESGGINGISNLLNLTDGILNDILHFQIIATFNTDLENLDNALLRSGRLLSRKYFDKLNKDDATVLINKLGLDLTPKNGMTLSDIYSYKNEVSILYHNIVDKKTKAGLGFVANHYK